MSAREAIGKSSREKAEEEHKPSTQGQGHGGGRSWPRWGPAAAWMQQHRTQQRLIYPGILRTNTMQLLHIPEPAHTQSAQIPRVGVLL